MIHCLLLIHKGCIYSHSLTDGVNHHIMSIAFSGCAFIVASLYHAVRPSPCDSVVPTRMISVVKFYTRNVYENLSRKSELG